MPEQKDFCPAEVLYVDNDQEIREIVTEVEESIRPCRLSIVKTLEEASGILDNRKINGMVVDGMFFPESLFAFLKQVRERYPDLPVTVLVVGIDMIVDLNFIETLKTFKVKIIPKLETFNSGRIKEILVWCPRANNQEET